MPKLYFRYGAMCSAKSMNMLAVAHNYEGQGKKVLVMKPALDTRHGSGIVVSRAGLERPADIILDPGRSPEEQLPDSLFGWSEKDDDWTGNPISCVLVDESQFLTPAQVDRLRKITYRVPVICYGLRTDFREQLFPGAKRLMEVADEISEIKTTCMDCERKAIFNHRIGARIWDPNEPTIKIGGDDMYVPLCYRCHTLRLESYEDQ